MPETDEKLMDVETVAKRLDCSVSFLYARLADGSLHHYRLGNGQGCVRISEAHLTEYLASRERKGPGREKKYKHLT